VVEVRVQGNRLPSLLSHVRNVDQSVDPAIGPVNDAARRHSKPLGGEPEATDVGNADQPLANEPQVLWHEVVRVAPGHHDVVQAGLGLDVSERLLPTLASWLQRGFGDGVRVSSNGIRAGAEHAVSRAHRGC